jgi:putative FmdB family regulatory protein
MCPTYDFVCTKCGNAEIHFLPMSECTKTQVCEECGGEAERAYLQAATINDSTSAIHIVKPPEYTHMINSAKAQNRWKKIKDKKKRAEAKAEAASMSKFKT